MAHALPYYTSVRITSLPCAADLPSARLPRLHAAFHSAPALSTYVPTVLLYCSAGISTCCPSTTAFALALGPDLPREDQLYPGNLGYSADRIPTYLSLLIPAFSLACSPPPLTMRLRPGMRCSPTNTKVFRSFGGVFQPRTFSARGLSASELLRTLSMYGCF